MIGLSVFKVLPLVELFIAFLGEWIASKIHKNTVLIFCTTYPILMGAVQKTMDWLDSRYELKLDSIAEMQSLFYASLPYKLVYLGIESFSNGMIVLVIKILFKTIVYVIVPFLKAKKELTESKILQKKERFLIKS